jgi:hypothetical protein
MESFLKCDASHNGAWRRLTAPDSQSIFQNICRIDGTRRMPVSTYVEILYTTVMLYILTDPMRYVS